MGETKSVGIWIRVSTEDQVKGESPEHHEKRARYYAESKDWCVKEVYRLEAVSGKSVMEHPETKRMLADVRSHKITGIIFSKLARLARNTRELLDFADIFRDCDADLVSLQESIDTSTPAGRLFYTMIAAMAQWEREEIAERVAASVPIRAKLGKPLGGAAPFGYQWIDKKLVINPEEAPVRKRVYELFLEHRRKRKVARLLNEAGHRTRNGGRFSDTTVDRLLRDPIAKGKRRMNYTKSLGQNKKWKMKPEDEWVHIDVEPIVGDEIWAQCNQILGEQHQKQNRRPAEHLFTGIVFCTCGNKMYVPHKSTKYTCYKCHNKILAPDLETIYHEQLKTFFFSNDEISSYLNKADELINDRQNLFVSLEQEAKKLKQDMDKLVQLHLDGEMPKEGFGNHYRPLEDRLKQIENQLPELQGEIDFLKIQYLSSDEVLTEAKDLHERWPMLELSEKRNIVETITQRITVGKDDVSINLSYMPSSAEMTTGMQHNLRDSSHTQA
ncbi:MAG: recombinase family protein [Ignavibacteriae bacterium]|nr:recombinase family protein [Ignavibacteria bacterium]MBI3365978.1 recombinase family protein [Ignavibacteriota bacterium]